MKNVIELTFSSIFQKQQLILLYFIITSSYQHLHTNSINSLYVTKSILWPIHSSLPFIQYNLQMHTKPSRTNTSFSFYKTSNFASILIILLLYQLSIVVTQKGNDRILIQFVNPNKNTWIKTDLKPLLTQNGQFIFEESQQREGTSSSQAENSFQQQSDKNVVQSQQQTSPQRVQMLRTQEQQFKKWLSKNNLLVDPYAHSSNPNQPSQTPKFSFHPSQALTKHANTPTKTQPSSAKNVNLDVLLDKGRMPIQYHMISPQKTKNAKSWRKMVNHQFDQETDIQLQEFQYYEEKYKLSTYEEIPFCIVVPTYNNAEKERYLKNMRSIVMQNYSNFHIVVFDDASKDHTGELIAEFLQKQNKVPRERYHVQRNAHQMRAMYNLRRAALEFCKPEEVFLIVDGDDELLGRQVLKLFSAFFQKEDAWFVYSNFLINRNSGVGYSRPFPSVTIQRNAYRLYPFVTSHLRAFYTQLFRNIKDEDLRGDDGQYLRAANDVAICIPCLQQSHKRVKYLPQLTYFYNSDTGQNNHYLRAMEQRNNDRKLRRKTPYKPLEELLPKS